MRKYILLFASLVLMITLASCSKSNPKQKKTTKDDEMKVGEMMQENKEHVWFIGREDEPLDKNTKIDRYIITKNGQMKVYVAERIPAQKLGDLLKKDEKSLIRASS